MILNGKFKNRYHGAITENSFQNEDIYLVTLCAKSYKNHFGIIENDEMVLSKSGLVAKECWMNLSNNIPHLETGEFVIMPNHIHGIIRFKQEVNITVSEHMVADMQIRIYAPETEVKNLTTVIGDYKKQVKKYIRLYNPVFDWQPSFYEYVISNKSEFTMIEKHIRENPAKWKTDCFNFNRF